MITISSTELKNNMDKYLDLAKKEKITVTQRGSSEVFELVKATPVKRNNLDTAITAEELLVGIEADIHEIYKRKAKK